MEVWKGLAVRLMTCMMLIAPPVVPPVDYYNSIVEKLRIVDREAESLQKTIKIIKNHKDNDSPRHLFTRKSVNRSLWGVIR